MIRTTDTGAAAMSARPGRMIVFGMGQLGRALLQGWSASGCDVSGWVAVDPLAATAGAQCHIVRDVAAARALGPFGMAVIAVKPVDVAEVLWQVRSLLAEDAIVISVAAGVSLALMEEVVGLADVVRAMPNLAAAKRESVTFLCAGQRCRSAALDRATQLFTAVGHIYILSHEDDMHVATAVSGSGPALVYRFLEAVRDAAQLHGMEAEMAERVVVGMAFGALALARDGSPLARLRDGVTSPRGTTAAALEILGGDGLLDRLLGDTVAAAKVRSRELGTSPACLPRRPCSAEKTTI